MRYPFALEKKNRNNSFRKDVSRTTVRSKMELFVTKVLPQNFAVVAHTPLFKCDYLNPKQY